MGTPRARPDPNNAPSECDCAAGGPTVSGERGAALIGTLAIGFVFVLVIAQTLITLGRLSANAADVTEAASYAAQHGARYGDAEDAARIARDLIPDAIVIAVEDGTVLSVEVSVEVPLVGPEHSPIRRTVTGRATAPYSPYRSRP